MTTTTPSRMSSASTYYIPTSDSTPITPNRTPSPDAWSTPGTSYFDSPIGRRSSIGSTTTLGGSIRENDNSPARRKSLEWTRESAKAVQFREPVSIGDEEKKDAAASDIEGIPLLRNEEWLSELKLGRILGEGQWSTVYSAQLDGNRDRRISMSERLHWRFQSKDLPPSAPLACVGDKAHRRGGEGRLFAVKVGNGRSSAKVLRNEARFLSFLMEKPCYKDYVVGFFGYSVERNMLVLENLPLTLEHFIASLETLGRVERYERVTSQLLPMARRLVCGLDALHRAEVIHGDIKPSNVLLRPQRMHEPSLESAINNGNGFEYRRKAPVKLSRPEFDYLEPVYCDFSAARFDYPDSIPSESAGTYDYMAPELFSKRKTGNYPTPSSDVYALGMTLLVAITGRSPYADAANLYMRRAMAMRGMPLDFALADAESYERLHVVRIELSLSKSLNASAYERWSAGEWKSGMDAGLGARG